MLARTRAGLLLLAPLLFATTPAAAATPPTPSPVRLTARLDRPKLLSSKDGADAWLVVSMNSDPRSTRLPVNLAIVIDISPSMAGEKIADAKAAAIALVGRLGARDRAALVAYGGHAKVVRASELATDRAKAALVKAIAGLGEISATNIHDGLSKGRDETARFASAAYSNRIVLLSDGEANTGPATSPADLGAFARKIYASGIAVSSIGIGLAFSEDTMMAIANEGGGTYYYAEGSGALTDLLDEDLRTAATTVAHKPVVTIDLAEGVTLLRTVGYAVEHPPAPCCSPGRGPGFFYIRPGDLFAGVERKIVLRVKVPVHATGEVAVGRIGIEYRDATAKDAVREVWDAVVATGVTDPMLVEEGRDKDASAKALRAAVAADKEEAAKLYEEGSKAAAATKLSEAKAKISVARKAGYAPAKTIELEDADVDVLIERSKDTRPDASPKFLKAAKKAAYDSAK